MTDSRNRREEVRAENAVFFPSVHRKEGVGIRRTVPAVFPRGGVGS